MATIRISKNRRCYKIVSIQTMGMLAVCFTLFFFVQDIRDNLYDYNAEILKSLQKEGYNTEIESYIGKEKEVREQNKIKEKKLKSTTADIIIAPEEQKYGLKDYSKSIGMITTEKPADDKYFVHGINFEHTWPSPIEMLGENTILKVKPIFGEHRPDKDAVFSFAVGLTLKELIRFIGSLLSTGYDGDISVAVEQKHKLPTETLQYLEYHSKNSNLIVYPAELVCKRVKMKKRCKVFKMFMHKEIGGYLPDPRPHRELSQLRFEYYWAWSTLYSPKARILLLDSRDSIFQSNPFKKILFNIERKIMVFEESNSKRIVDEPSNRLWLSEGHERKSVQKLGKNYPISAGTIVGGQAAIETFGRAMVNQWDTTQCKLYGCDQGHVNFLIYSNALLDSPGVGEVIIEKFGESFVMSLNLEIKYSRRKLRKSKNFRHDDSNNTYLNKNGETLSIIHQFDQDNRLKKNFDEEKANNFVTNWELINTKIRR